MLEHQPLVGWSDVPNSPEILAAIRKNRKSSLLWTWVFSLLFPLGFLVAGLLSDEVPLGEALIIGVGLGLLILVLNLWRVKGTTKPAWEGVVLKKLEKKRSKRDSDDGSYTSYMEYIVLIRTDRGKKKRIVEHQRDLSMYRYLQVGDRVRYHPALETYEKYDKSKDKEIYCNVCRCKNPISNDRCSRCQNLLFK